MAAPHRATAADEKRELGERPDRVVREGSDLGPVATAGEAVAAGRDPRGRPKSPKPA